MKKSIIFTENELINMVKLVLESLEEYDTEDFQEVFFKFFRPWIQKKHGDEISEAPLSYLIKKYLQEFADDLGLDVYKGYSASSRIPHLGKEIVKKGLHSLPSLKKNDAGFIEKYKKPIKSIIELIELPDYITLELEEPTPYNVSGKIKGDFVQYIKNQKGRTHSGTFKSLFKKYLTDLLGVEFGLTSHGKVNLFFNDDIVWVGFEDWIKNVFDKEIKKEIKGLPNAKAIHSIKFKMGSNDADLKIVFKGHTPWNIKRETKDGVIQLLKNKGYNTDIINVDY